MRFIYSLKLVILYVAIAIIVKGVILFASSVSSITLPSLQPTRQTKYSQTSSPGSRSLSTPPASAPVTEAKGVSVYRVKTNKDETCILLKTDGVIEVSYSKNFSPIFFVL